EFVQVGDQKQNGTAHPKNLERVSQVGLTRGTNLGERASWVSGTDWQDDQNAVDRAKSPTVSGNQVAKVAETCRVLLSVNGLPGLLGTLLLGLGLLERGHEVLDPQGLSCPHSHGLERVGRFSRERIECHLAGALSSSPQSEQLLPQDRGPR